MTNSSRPTRSRPATPTWRLLLAVVLFASVFAGQTASALSNAAIAADGSYYEVRSGLYMDLFPDGTETAPWNPVLALVDAEGAARLVPGSEGIGTDSRAFLLVEGEELIVLWTEDLDAHRSRFLLAGFDGATFSSPVELSGDALRIKGPPRLALTSDEYVTVDADGETNVSQRTTLHLVWWEERASGSGVRVLYTPVVLLDGEYVGWNPVIPLDSFDTHDPLDESIEHRALQEAASISQSSQHSAVLALPQLDSGRMFGLKIDVLPADLLALADEARSHIVLVGRAAPAGPDGLQEIADYARSHIVLVGRADLHPGVREHIAQSVVEGILERETFDPEELDALADEAWRETLAAGASILGNPQRSLEPSCGIVALDPSSTAASSAHYLQVCLSSDREIPPTPRDLTHHLLISENAEEILVVWETLDGSLGFQRSTDTGWGEARTVRMPEGVSRNDALQALGQQLRPE